MSPAAAAPEWIDVSVPVRDGMVHWPGDPPVEIGRTQSIAGGDEANLTRLSMSAHTGTHIDAPAHFVDRGAAIEALPLEVALGLARVIEVASRERVTAAELAPLAIGDGDRLLVKTRNSSHAWWEEPFAEDFVCLDPDAAEHIAESGARLVGVDYLSVGGLENGAATHRALLGSGVWIIEGLDLSSVTAGEYELICLPVKIAGSDGAPARALLRRREPREGGGEDE